MNDSISRQAAIKEDRGHVEYTGVCGKCGFAWIWYDTREYLKFCPNCGADLTISALQEQDVHDTNVGGMISRQEAIDALYKMLHDCFWADDEELDAVITTLNDLPSAQPERKTGRWLIREDISDAQCSECKMYFRNVYDMDNSDAFCRHCGAKMEGLKVVKDE